MNVITRPRMTTEEYLTWEQTQEGRYEFGGESIVEINGESLAHNLIVGNFYRTVWGQIDRRRHLVVTSGVRLLLNGRVRYPDVIVGNAVETTAVDRVPEPVVVFEVLSPSSYRQDSQVKTLEYSQFPTIEHYVMLAQDAVWAQVWSRSGEGWVGKVYTAGMALRFDTVGASLGLADCYEGVTLAPS